MQGKRIILGVSGGIAAYKSVYLLRELQKAGADVRVVMTPSATRFVGLETFAALTRHEVPVHVFSSASSDGAVSETDWSKHIHWAEWADLMVVAPCTAHTLSGLVHGRSDNMLLTTAMALRGPLLLCPTMDGGMYRSPAVARNLKLAAELGIHILPPDSGYLASGLTDEGRLPETSVILEQIGALLQDDGNIETGALSLHNDGPISGKRVLVTAGPTREFIDAVRFISNPSSGKMGIALAEAARDMGADVTLVHGPISIPVPTGMTSVPVISATDLFETVSGISEGFDIIVMAAAVSDFTPTTRVHHKVKKNEADSSISLNRTPDTLKWLGENRKEGQILVGFAMETENLKENAEAKLASKKCDWVAANLLREGQSGFETDSNELLLISKNTAIGLSGTKREIAVKLFEQIVWD